MRMWKIGVTAAAVGMMTMVALPGDGAEVAAPIAPTDSALKRSPTACRFDSGEALAYELRSTTVSSVDPTALQRALQGGSGAPQHQTTRSEVHLRLDVEALTSTRDGATLVAGRWGLLSATRDEGSLLSGDDFRAPFLMKLSAHCELLDIARMSDTPDHVARVQQALIAELQWSDATDDANSRVAVERDGTGRYEAKYARAPGSGVYLQRQKLGYLELARASRDTVRGRRIDISGPGLRVFTDARPWFGRLESDETHLLRVDKTVLGTRRRTLSAQRMDEHHAVMAPAPSNPTWVWGSLLGAEIPTPVAHRPAPTAPAQAQVQPWITNMTTDDALATYADLCADGSSRSDDRVGFLLQWIGNDPRRVDALVVALKAGRLTGRFAEAALFDALSRSSLPAANQALVPLIAEDGVAANHKIRAAFALYDADRPPAGFGDALIAAVRKERAASDDADTTGGAMTSLLGAVMHAQKDSNPALARAAESELLATLEEADTPRHTVAALLGIGNAREDGLLDHVMTFAKHDDGEVRAAAARALRGMSPEATADLFEPWFTGEADPDVRIALVRAFESQARNARYVSPQVVEATIAHLETTAHPSTRDALLGVLSQAATTGNDQASNVLAEMLQAELAKADRDLRLITRLGRLVKASELL